ncbi:discoidin domain-containing protein, partial [Streptococcus himalayensis]
MKASSKELFEKRRRYAIRTLAVGTCSVMIGAFLLSQNQLIAAEEVTEAEGANASRELESGRENAGNTLDTSYAAPAASPEMTNPSEANQAENQKIDIGNDSVAHHYTIENGVLRTESIENKLTKEKVEFAADSKEFNVRFKSDEVAEPISAEPLSTDKESWTVRSNSVASETSMTEGPARLAVDNNPNTIWHTNWGAGTGPQGTLPAHVELEFPQAKHIKTLAYLPRQVGTNGDAKEYKIYAKMGESAEYQEVKNGRLEPYPNKEWQFIDLGDLLAVRALKFEVISTQNGNSYGAAAELDVSEKSVTELQLEAERRRKEYAERVQRLEDKHSISMKNLRVKKDGVKTEQTAEGQRTTFTFLPYHYQGKTLNLRYVVDLKNDAKFMQSHLEIAAPEGQEDLAIDTIDLQSYKLKGDEKIWKLPKQADIAEMAGFNGFYAGLGQPVYVKSFYTGSEFPVAWNTVDDTETLYSRYYSGKSLNQLTKNKDGYYETWNTVLGVARSDDYQVLQQDFYKYIQAIGQDTYYRKQYNSWFDHMLNINAKNIQNSFNEIEKGFTNGGVAPLDSFVVDDGWQDMDTLWDFNTKFPNKLYDSSKQAQRLGSNFGLWMGPQGGYSQPGHLADALVRQNKGSKHAGVVYIGDKRYVEGLNNLYADYEDKFGINYWKLDGLLLNPRPDTDPNGNFIGGGYKNMYSMTEAHERWIGLYNTIRKSAKDPSKMWINLTSYITPSPWYLQWVNSIWMQNSSDVDYEDNVKRGEYASLDFGNDANEAITYRDDRYEELINLRKWQLPFSNIYNHDPVYGNTSHSAKRIEPNGDYRPPIEFSTDDLRNYLYMLGTRGTGFWEFYYSYNKMDDAKWQVNGEAVNWIESNFETLKHARFHGGKPGHGEVYGYSAWNEDSGILSIRNPINRKQSYTVRLDRLIGVPENMAAMYRTTVLGDKRHDKAGVTNYNEEVTVELEPYESLVFQYSKKKDETSATVENAKATSSRTVDLRFNERVLIDQATFTVEGNRVSNASLNADLRTVTLTLEEELENGQTVSVGYSNVKDNAAEANISTGTVQTTYFSEGRIEDISHVRLGTPLKQDGIEGTGEFSVTVKTTLDKLGQTLAQQGDDWKLSVDDNGRVHFAVKELEVQSAPHTDLKPDDRGMPDKLIAPHEEVVITAVRNRNGSLRLYLNGEVHNTAYDKTKVNESLSIGDLTVGTTDFAGRIDRFILENHAHDFKSAAALRQEVAPKPYLAAIAGATVTAPSYDADDGGVARPVSAALDGDARTYWASDPNQDNRTSPQSLTFTLAEPKMVAGVDYTPRHIANAVGNIKKAYIETSLDGEHWTRADLVGKNEENMIQLNPAHTDKQSLQFAPVMAKYVRLTATETAHWQASSVNKVVAAAEVALVEQVMPEITETPTYNYLYNALVEAAGVKEKSYTAESYATLVAAVQAGSAALTSEDQETLDRHYEAVKAALAHLEKVAETPVIEMHHSVGDIPAPTVSEKPTLELHHSVGDVSAPTVSEKPILELHHSVGDVPAPTVSEKPILELHHSVGDVAAPTVSEKPTLELHHSVGDVPAPTVSEKPILELHHSLGDVAAPTVSEKPTLELHHSVGDVAAPTVSEKPTLELHHSVGDVAAPTVSEKPTLELHHSVGDVPAPTVSEKPTLELHHSVGDVAAPTVSEKPTLKLHHSVGDVAAPTVSEKPTLELHHAVGGTVADKPTLELGNVVSATPAPTVEDKMMGLVHEGT